MLDGGSAKAPTAAQMEYGELAVNYNTADVTLFLKDSADKIVAIAGGGFAETSDIYWQANDSSIYPKDLAQNVGVGGTDTDFAITLGADGSIESTAVTTDSVFAADVTIRPIAAGEANVFQIFTALETSEGELPAYAINTVGDVQINTYSTSDSGVSDGVGIRLNHKGPIETRLGEAEGADATKPGAENALAISHVDDAVSEYRFQVTRAGKLFAKTYDIEALELLPGSGGGGSDSAISTPAILNPQPS